jgi:hypothetical protein
MHDNDDGSVRCSFCGKSQKQVRKMIAGPDVGICDECIDLCNEIIEEEQTTPPPNLVKLSIMIHGRGHGVEAALDDDIDVHSHEMDHAVRSALDSIRQDFRPRPPKGVPEDRGGFG